MYFSFQINTPLENSVIKENTFPYIVATGHSTKEIQRYHIVLEEHFINVSWNIETNFLLLTFNKQRFSCFRSQMIMPSSVLLIYGLKFIRSSI